MLIKKELDTIAPLPCVGNRKTAVSFFELPRSGKILQLTVFNGAGGKEYENGFELFFDGKNGVLRHDGIWDEKGYRKMSHVYEYDDTGIDNDDLRIAQDFLHLNSPFITGAASLVKYLVMAKRFAYQKKRQEMIDERIEKFRPYLTLSCLKKTERKSLENYARNNLFAEHTVGIIDQKKAQSCVCGHCRKSFLTPERWHVGEKKACPICGSKLNIAGVKSRKASYLPEKAFFYCARRQNCIVVTLIKAYCDVTIENTRYFFSTDKVHVYPNNGNESYLYVYSPGSYGYFPDWREQRNEYIYASDYNIYVRNYFPIFPNLEKVFTESWRGICVKDLMEQLGTSLDHTLTLAHMGYSDMLVRNHMSSYLKKSPYLLRQVVKLRKDKLNTFASAFGMLPDMRKIYLEENVTFDEHCFLRHFGKEFISSDQIKRFRALNIASSDPEVLIKEGLSFKRILNYVEKQSAKTGRYGYTCVQIWSDYIKACHTDRTDLTRRGNLCPPDIVVAHDRQLEVHRAETAERDYQKGLAIRGDYLPENNLPLEKRIAAVTQSLKKIDGYTDGVYVIVSPKCLADFAQEGTSLANCVWRSSYYEKHAARQSTILFVRRSTDIGRPFFCMELSPNGDILQLQGYSHCSAPTDIEFFCEDFIKHYKKVYKLNQELA